MFPLFAALDAHGAMRFIDDVPRGAACGCFCPICSSPLVAKQGDELQWHFAHEGGQLRPECLPGARNLLRLLAIEHLTQRAALTFEPYRTSVTASPGSVFLGSPVQWVEQPVGGPSWRAAAAVDQPVADLVLEKGRSAILRIEVDDTLSQSHYESAPEVARGVFWVPLPSNVSLRNRSDVDQYLARAGRLLWEYVPDHHGHMEAARRAGDAQLQEQRAAAGRRWARIRNQLPAQAPDEPEEVSRPTQHRAPPSPAPAAPVPWAPNHKAGTPFQFRRLQDGTRWVLYTANNSTQLLAPYPEAFDGWDEFFPPSIAVPLTGTNALQVVSLNALLLFFRSRAQVVRITSNPAEFASL